MNKYENHPLQLSCEFFPPKTEKGVEKLSTVAKELARINPEFFSVTFGAGGSTQDRTADTVIKIQELTKIETAAHLSCVGATKNTIRDILSFYMKNNIRRIVALRGDIPSGMVEIGDFKFASELVAFIRQETGDHFHIEVAAYPEFHPQAKSADDDIKHFIEKVNAGANSAITQYFFNADAYYYFIDQLESNNVSIPVTPGIMPINNFVQLARFSDMCGAEIPRWLRKRFESYGDDLDSIVALGLDIITDLCEQLIKIGVPGLHFYAMNQSKNTLKIIDNLKV
ncbi:MAG: methylenetetrahydrofolate reductase [NAD(P)H] [Methylococcales bacterium]|jgi:methylenetetrahydrofolate reductase (NADPH)|nr:methylenetetrahydrofolate reductase [NAD(P)H] [Methylococcales bacterium]MBT7410460.1 methylenetetrahydrofolate reductase [NAD(P)H] [Methylococcales bacterium]